MGAKLVPVSKAIANRLGIVSTKQGLMIKSSKLIDKKRYQSKTKEPENQVVKTKSEIVAKKKLDKIDESKGLY